MFPYGSKINYKIVQNNDFHNYDDVVKKYYYTDRENYVEYETIQDIEQAKSFQDFISNNIIPYSDGSNSFSGGIDLKFKSFNERKKIIDNINTDFTARFNEFQKQQQQNKLNDQQQQQQNKLNDQQQQQQNNSPENSNLS